MSSFVSGALLISYIKIETTPTLPGRFLFTSSYSNIISLHIKFLFFSADGSKLLARTLIPYARDPGYRTSTYHSPERVVTNGK